MGKNTRLKTSPNRKKDDTVANISTVGKGNGLNSQIGTEPQTKLEVRFLESETSLSSSRKRLLNKILSEPHESFFLSSREMARRYKVDSSTIVRTVQAMGYEKFADFIDDLRNHFVEQITPYSSMKAAAQKKGSVDDYIHQSIDQDLENVNAFKAGLDAEKIIELVKQIHHTRRIIIVGVDYAAPLAGMLAYGLVRLGYDAEAPAGSTGVVQNKVRIMTKNDLLIAISFGQGLRETVEAVQRARRQNVPTFGITDSDKTPIARFCEHYIIASTVRTSFLDSYVAPVAAINAVLVACAHNQPKRALELLEQTDREDSNGARWYRENKDSDKKGVL
jgi:DNA-binding MurR/RpiR family transcriptional regulator